MEKLSFKPFKEKSKFRSNYKLHDHAEFHGNNLLVQWGVSFIPFGEDRRLEKLWEKGNDKPDIIIEYKGKFSLLDWKGKQSNLFLANKRAVESYIRWEEKTGMPVFLAFLVFDEKLNLSDRRIARLGFHNFRESENLQWDKNKTIMFKTDLPKFTKENLIVLMQKKLN